MSTFTPISVKPAGLYFLYIWSSSGISCWQGPHQVAQKFTITTWPLYWRERALAAVELGQRERRRGTGGIAGERAEAATMAVIAQRVRNFALELCMKIS